MQKVESNGCKKVDSMSSVFGGSEKFWFNSESASFSSIKNIGVLSQRNSGDNCCAEGPKAVLKSTSHTSKRNRSLQHRAVNQEFTPIARPLRKAHLDQTSSGHCCPRSKSSQSFTPFWIAGIRKPSKQQTAWADGVTVQRIRYVRDRRDNRIKKFEKVSS